MQVLRPANWVAKRVFGYTLIGVLKVADKLAGPPPPMTEWQKRGAAISINGTDLGTAVATSPARDRLRSRDEAGG